MNKPTRVGAIVGTTIALGPVAGAAVAVATSPSAMAAINGYANTVSGTARDLAQRAKRAITGPDKAVDADFAYPQA